ncbi:hypothetical protein [Hymenobacter psoromatis]|uniref:hypothetical protein n=1 Tax=Hymenobacter psoromatis TaxID=1484116 RepID=UPI001CBB7393|nr:hypothetical protein [Hymenobacter psoromatis]
MPTPGEQAEQHIGETKGQPNHVHDLIHGLSTRFDALMPGSSGKARKPRKSRM